MSDSNMSAILTEEPTLMPPRGPTAESPAVNRALALGVWFW
jgi:hypothetical protein